MSQQAREAEGSLILEAQGRVGAALTTPGRASTSRWSGSGKQDGKVYERNQCQSLTRDPPAPNLADMGRSAAHARKGDSEAG